MQLRRIALVCVVLSGIVCFSGKLSNSALALDANGVLVLYNELSPEGKQIADYYVQTHPGARQLKITGLGSTSENITADNYLSIVRPQVLAAVNGTSTPTDVFVTTKGMPLRINVTESAPTAVFPNLPTYVDPGGVVRTILNWQPYSSLESELATIDTVSSWQMMGDQSYSIAGQFTANPLYRSSASFSHDTSGLRLATRLDGFTVNDVISSIDRAQHAFLGPTNALAGPMQFIIDADPTKTYAVTMTSLANDVLTPAGLPMTYDGTSAYVGTAKGPLIGYVSHGVNQASTPANYIPNLDATLANGAVINTWESYNAYSFMPGGPHSNQGSIGQWLQKGGTAGAGNVEEPGGSISTIINEDQMFQMLINGKTWAEAAWSGARQFSFVNTVVGDPLMTWKQLTFGDINLDGRVDNADLALMGANWGKTMASGGYGWGMGDLNSDGVVDARDLALLSSNWGSVSSWAQPIGGSLILPAPDGTNFIPEPSSFVLAAIGAGLLAGLGWRRRKRRPSAAAAVAR